MTLAGHHTGVETTAAEQEDGSGAERQCQMGVWGRRGSS